MCDQELKTPDCAVPDCGEKGTYGYLQDGENHKIYPLCEGHWGKWASERTWEDAGRY